MKFRTTNLDFFSSKTVVACMEVGYERSQLSENIFFFTHASVVDEKKMANFKNVCLGVAIVFLHVQFGFHCGVSALQTVASKRLADDLLTNYGSRYVRPVKDVNSTLSVYFRAKLIWFADFKWKDEFLTWNPDDYGNVTEINFGKDQIWFPDVTPYERVDTGPAEANMDETFLTVDYEGQVVYYNIAFYAIFCKMDVRLFPYDSHRCAITFSAYSFEGDAVSLYYVNDSDSSENILKKNGVWSVSGYDIKDIETEYLCCPTPYREVYYTIYIRRESGFYVLNVGVPTVLLSLTTLSVFLLHPESGEKVSLCVNNVLALIIFQQLLATNMPPTGDEMPIVAYYFVVVISISFLSVLTTCLTLGIYHNKAKRPLPKLLKLILYPGGCLSQRRVTDSSDGRGNRKGETLIENHAGMEDKGIVVSPGTVPTDDTRIIPNQPMQPSVRSINRGSRSRHSEASAAAFETEWVNAAIRLDMIFFGLALSAMLFALAYCLFRFIYEMP
ncbi:neuronal acetylcholine receptor subunit alpha-7-like isoform X2 [Apostichopus japonicus]|uniref:neuronal acetylcholine receptor subunit alpha-7-like isoform X2 n=1 Tax=Stichopus japonicus TaxID=307972 RepID=UPI003AB145A4